MGQGGVLRTPLADASAWPLALGGPGQARIRPTAPSPLIKPAYLARPRFAFAAVSLGAALSSSRPPRQERSLRSRPRDRLSRLWTRRSLARNRRLSRETEHARKAVCCWCYQVIWGAIISAVALPGCVTHHRGRGRAGLNGQNCLVPSGVLPRWTSCVYALSSIRLGRTARGKSPEGVGCAPGL